MSLNHHRAGHGEPLLLIHGIGSQWQGWAPVLDRLAAERDVVALDLPGFGESPELPRETPPTVPNLARAVEELMADLGVERPHVAGNSLGGYLALELAARGSARSAVALSPAGFPRSYRDQVFLHRSLRMSVAAGRRAAPIAGAVTAT